MKPAIDIESTQALQTVPHEEIQQHQGSPLDLPVEQFKGGLERRGANRKALMEWIRGSLVEGVDFGRIHTVGKDKCREGKACKNDYHWSKPVLFKPGSEKICGMLGVTPTFPSMKDYEDAALKGVEIRIVILRCEMLSPSGQLCAFGAGARSLEKEYGDMNKALKMASKSAMIDATLRMGGLSELFTQDLDDMHAAENAKEPPIQPQSQKGVSTPPPTNQNAPQTKPEPPKATQKHLDRLVSALEHMKEQAIGYFQSLKQLGPNQTIANLSLEHCPTTKPQYDDLLVKIKAFAEGPATEETGVGPNDGLGGLEAWRYVKMHFGKQVGKALGELDKKYCFGLWANYVAETEYNGRPLKPEQIATNQALRAALDQLGKYYQFTKG